jgi:hypothetical protein
LANDLSLPYHRLDEKSTIALLKKYKLDERLKRMNEWIYKEE